MDPMRYLNLSDDYDVDLVQVDLKGCIRGGARRTVTYSYALPSPFFFQSKSSSATATVKVAPLQRRYLSRWSTEQIDLLNFEPGFDISTYFFNVKILKIEATSGYEPPSLLSGR